MLYLLVHSYSKDLYGSAKRHSRTACWPNLDACLHEITPFEALPICTSQMQVNSLQGHIHLCHFTPELLVDDDAGARLHAHGKVCAGYKEVPKNYSILHTSAERHCLLKHSHSPALH